ncbi:MAG: M4 family metallopeptidase [Deltaproteobacteria bacterium]|nr:M4 family metallopeptidase [Deltaproteobacteria bacterium]
MVRGKSSFLISLSLSTLLAPYYAAAQQIIEHRNPQSREIVALGVVAKADDNKCQQLQPLSKEEKVKRARDFIYSQTNSFPLAEGIELVALHINTDKLGRSHIRFNLKYKNIPLLHAQVIAHLSCSGEVTGINGQAIKEINIEALPKFNKQAAVEKAKAELGLSDEDINKIKARLAINVANKSAKQKAAVQQLVWQVIVRYGQPERLKEVLINAQQGRVIAVNSGEKTDLNRQIYDCSLGDGNCYAGLYDEAKNYTFGRQEGAEECGANPKYNDNDTDNLYSFLGSIHELVKEKLGRDGANNKGGISPDASAYAPEVTNAFTYADSADVKHDAAMFCPNAFYSPIGYMSFCRGMVSSEIVGHEYGHALENFSVKNDTEKSWGLNYVRESGAISEGLADYFSALVERKIYGFTDWQMWLDDYSTRNMASPIRSKGRLGGLPARYNSDVYYCGEGDNGGVHYNSTVFSHLAYVLENGGEFNNCRIQGLGQDKAFNVIYRAVSNYFTPSTSFYEAAIGLSYACRDLYDRKTCDQVLKATLAAELNQGGTCSDSFRLSPKNICSAIDLKYIEPKNPSLRLRGKDLYFELRERGRNDYKIRLQITSTDEEGNPVVKTRTVKVKKNLGVFRNLPAKSIVQFRYQYFAREYPSYFSKFSQPRLLAVK